MKTYCKLLSKLLSQLLGLTLLFSPLVFARGAAVGWCEQGNQTVITPGSSASTTRVQRSFPACTVTVYLPGTTTKATLYSDVLGTAKANPFTALSTGMWVFWADNGALDVNLSGGGISAPFTLGAFPVNPTLTFNVQLFGAVGNGSHDDTTAITAAITAATATGGTVTFPCGTFPFSSELTIGSRITLEGGGEGDGSANSPACTTLKKTADVIGIRIASGANLTILRNFMLTSTASTGTSDGIAVGDADNTNGAGEVRIENVSVYSQKGNGINVRNGNSGVLDHILVQANGASGVLISNQQLSVDNTNAWRLYSSSAFSNATDGFRFNVASSTIATGIDSEGNSRYGIYANRPYIYLSGYTEANATNNVYLDSNCFDCFTVVRDVNNTSHQGNAASFMFNMAGQGITPELSPTTGSFGVRGALHTPAVIPAYGATVTINNDIGNHFIVNATNNTGFNINAPADPNFPQRITICINNASGGALGTVTWIGYVMSPWASPQNGYMRCIDFERDTVALTWTEIYRTERDIGAGSYNKADFVNSTVAPVVITGQSTSGSTTAFSYPNIAISAVWRTTCHAFTTVAGSAGTSTLTLQPDSATRAVFSLGTIDLTALSSERAVSTIEIVPANTAGRYIGVQFIVAGNMGGQFQVECAGERVQ